MADGKKTLTLKPSAGKRTTASAGVEVQRVGKRRPKPASADEAKRDLSDKERQNRIKALEGVSQSSAERKKLDLLKAEEERREKQRADEEQRRQDAEKEARRKEEDARKRQEEDAKKKAEAIAEREEARMRQSDDPAAVTATTTTHTPSGGSAALVEAEDRREKNKKQRRSAGKPRNDSRRGGAGRLNLNQIITDDGTGGNERTRSMAALKRMRAKEKQKLEDANAIKEKIIRDVIIPDMIAVSELANRMAERVGDVIKELMKNDIIASQSQLIDGDTAELIASEFGHRIKRVSSSDVEDSLIEKQDDDPAHQTPRAPVVTVMGHVDHGKTSLLDSLRKTTVASGEAGGITQHIGAYQVKTDSGLVTFIDTPGHAAFTEMRARGAKVTDIVILIIAADDGVQPQTIEAINHAKAAEVPLIVAINKCDTPEANPQKIYTQLLEQSLQVESMGGDVQAIEISAKAGTNLDQLLEATLLQAEILELKGNATSQGRGVIIEAKLEKGRGPMATVLVQAGVIKVGDIFVAGKEWGKVRALLSEKGEQVKCAEISKPVEVLGLNGTPQAGDDFVIVESEAKAREISEYRMQKQKDAENVANKRGSLEQMFSDAGEGGIRSLNIIIKADVQGSLEAIKGSLSQMATEEVEAEILHAAVGGITESDIALAGSTGGIVIGFNVRPNAQARTLAKRENVDIRFYSIIYNLLDDMKLILGDMLSPDISEDITGYAQVREVFSVSKVGKIAGCMITEGTFKRNSKARLIRDDTVIFDGEIKQLKRFKDDVKEVKEGYECGIALENFDDIKDGDRIECYDIKETTRSL